MVLTIWYVSAAKSQPSSRRYKCWRLVQRATSSVKVNGKIFTRGSADKSLARPGRKQATATKLGIYSTYSPRGSIYFLARWPNFCQPLKIKKNQKVVRPTRSPRQQRLRRRKKKWRTFNCFFQSREHVVDRRNQIRKIGWVIKTLEAQIGQFLLGYKSSVSRGIVVQEQGPLSWPSRGRCFSFKMSFSCTSRDE